MSTGFVTGKYEKVANCQMVTELQTKDKRFTDGAMRGKLKRKQERQMGLDPAEGCFSSGSSYPSPISY